MEATASLEHALGRKEGVIGPKADGRMGPVRIDFAVRIGKRGGTGGWTGRRMVK